MARRRVKITFPEVLVDRPLVFLMGEKFNIVPSIRRADVGPETGWIILELQGDEIEIDQAIEWAAEQGVRVDPIIGDVIEG